MWLFQEREEIEISCLAVRVDFSFLVSVQYPFQDYLRSYEMDQYPFQDYLRSYEMDQSVGGAKMGEPREKPSGTPTSRTWLVSHVPCVGHEPTPDTAMR